VLHGGFTAGRTTAHLGRPPGVADDPRPRMLYRSALAGSRAILVAFEEPVGRCARPLTLGWTWRRSKRPGILLITVSPDPAGILSGTSTCIPVGDHRRASAAPWGRVAGARRIDSHIPPPTGGTAELSALHHWLRDQQLTTVLT